MITIYHNSRCSKSRCALQLIEDKEVKIIEYLKTPLSREELQGILKKLAIPASDLIRKNESIFKEKFKEKELSEEQWVDAMLEFPKLIERPIIVQGDKAIIARPPELVKEFI